MVYSAPNTAPTSDPIAKITEPAVDLPGFQPTSLEPVGAFSSSEGTPGPVGTSPLFPSPNEALVEGTDGLDPRFAAAISNLIRASEGQLHIESGYRSPELQAQLYAKAVARYGPEGARKWVAPPGHSNHNRGMAVDLGGNTTIAHKLAPQFGLVFPMSWEPWHIEPVGARDTSHPQAYTTAPPGQVNPVHDDTLAHTADFQAANIANAMQAVMDPTKVGPIQQMGTAPTAPGQAGDTSAGGTLGADVKGGNVKPDQLYQALRATGMDAAHAAMFVSIAGRESGLNTGAHNNNASTGDNSFGLFQINLLNGGWTRFLQEHGIANPAQDLLTLNGSVRAVKAIFDSSGMTPWGGYKGVSWSQGTNPLLGIQASGGEVTMADLQPFLGQLH